MKKNFVTVAAAILLSAAAQATTLVAYFSFPIANAREAADASSGASVVPNSGGTGNAEFIAQAAAPVNARVCDARRKLVSGGASRRVACPDYP